MERAGSEYRPDIDGLRAVAVLLVLLFHLDVSPFGGGFIGVDVFFVISGFLITRIIHTELVESGSFSFARFYVRRLRRLFPAFIATIAMCLVAGLVMFSPEMMERFAGAAVFSIFSLSNVYFWLESGYFDTTATLKPLLHMWSLGVEEQFYLVWPPSLAALFLWAPWRAGPIALAVAAFASLVAAQAMLPIDAPAVFFLTPFRIYEFAFGAGLIWATRLQVHSRPVREVTLALGLALVVAAAVLYTEDTPFPGLSALIPCLGTALVIHAGLGSGPPTRLGIVLRNRVAVGIGLMSYSLYLVHWPIIVFYRYYVFVDLTGFEKAALFVLALVLATAMYFFVEKPFRRPVPFAAKGSFRFVTGCIAIAALFVASSAYAWANGGLAWRKPNALSAEQVQTGKGRRFGPVRKGCQIASFPDDSRCKADAPLQVLFIGNSHEPDGFNAFHALYGDRPGVNLVSFMTVNRCSFTVEEDRIETTGGDESCEPRFDKLDDPDFARKLDVVVVSINRPFIDAVIPLWDAVRLLKKRNPDLKVVALGGYLNLSVYCPELYNRFGTYEACKRPEYVTVFEPNETATPVFQKVNDLDATFIDKIGLLCPTRTLDSCLVSAGGEPFTYDSHHLSLSFAELLGRRLLERYSPELEATGFPKVEPPASD